MWGRGRGVLPRDTGGSTTAAAVLPPTPVDKARQMMANSAKPSNSTVRMIMLIAGVMQVWICQITPLHWRLGFIREDGVRVLVEKVTIGS